MKFKLVKIKKVGCEFSETPILEVIRTKAKNIEHRTKEHRTKAKAL